MGSEKKYHLRYLPLARHDVDETVGYMLDTLSAPQAAERFLTDLDKKAALLEENPYIGATYKGNHRFGFEYRRVFVGNYTVFYVILEDEQPKRVEVHRIIYSGRDMEEQI